MDLSVFRSRVRAHWGIENALHWVLDVTMNEDQQRTREGNGAETMAKMRRMALTMVRGDEGKEKDLHTKQVETGRMEQ